ncbi:siderophore ABC transporter substrate-binding protein [Brassicibacter mesophilus]|uniref:siderophore ABC transporter substrate-binding protein n=1 Tax=Brassicibacter mesophilus TaxID=745119 RepID=UPI003D23C091
MFKRKSLFTALLLMITILALTACGATQGTSNSEDNVKLQTKRTENSSMTIEHVLGKTVVNKNPEKVIVFDYATIDSLEKMGIEILGLPKSNVPKHLEKYNDDKYEDVGTLFEPNFEKIFELEPDVILVSARQAEVYDELAKIAPTVYLEVDGANYMESVIKNTQILGELFGKKDIVEKELSNVNETIEDLNKKVVDSGKNALIVMANDGSISAYGEGSRFGIIHKEFGFVPADKNIEASNHGNSITFEYILEKNPDYIFVIDRAAVAGGTVSAEQIFDNDIIKKTDAYKNDKIVYLSSQIWYVGSGGLTGTMTMIEDIQSGL